jgi:acyl-CoA reductase-like NAD-dependent aldehyde dehydrogenase
VSVADQTITADFAGLVERQRAYFKAGTTRPAAWRIEQLQTIRRMIDESRDDMYEALWHDLRRNRTDADLMDVDFNIREVDYALKHLGDWMKQDRIHTPLLMEPGHVRLRRDPLGVTLIIGAWNEPYMLTLAPLVAAVAAGNTAVLKPSEIAEATAQQTADMVAKYLDPEAVAVALGGIAETTALLEQQWDLIFFTGSPPVGKIIHQAAAKHLTPTVLELGGKNPTIVHSSANVRSAARRIAYGRYMNSGHICTAPDHVLVWPEVKDELVAELQNAITEFYGEDPKQSPDYGRVINRRNFDRLVTFFDSGTVAAGGTSDADELYIAPTVLVDVAVDAPIMQEEVFGPILPVLEIDSVDAVVDWVNERPRPLGLYVFTEDEDVAERIFDATNSGDACVNDCAVHPLVPELPFGGVGNSGMGKYHGHWGYESFTNARGVLYHSAAIDPGVKYPPYAEHQGERRLMDKLL